MITKIAQQNAANAILGGTGSQVSTSPIPKGKAHTAPSDKSTTEDDSLKNVVRTMQALMVDLGAQLSQINIAKKALEKILLPNLR
jgi:hypothetical protein